jgi:hypothetical protein
VYTFHDDWKFEKIGLLQWTNPEYLQNAGYFFAQLPKRKEQQEFAQKWHENEKEFGEWKKHLHPKLHPKITAESGTL